MLQQSHLWSLTLSLGVLTAIGFAQKWLPKTIMNEKIKKKAVLEDTDTDDSSSSSFELEEDASIHHLSSIWERSEDLTNEFHFSERIEI